MRGSRHGSRRHHPAAQPRGLGAAVGAAAVRRVPRDGAVRAPARRGHRPRARRRRPHAVAAARARPPPSSARSPTACCSRRPGSSRPPASTVAAHHARRYRDAGSTLVADLTSGIGADAMAFAGIGLRVLATDVDEATAAIATVNLRHFPDARGAARRRARAGPRGGGRRRGLRRPRPPDVVGQPRVRPGRLRAVARRGPRGPRRRSPRSGSSSARASPTRALPHDAHAQWVSVDGDVVEVGLWFGPLAPEGPGRSALVLRDGEAHVVEQTSDERPPTGRGRRLPLRARRRGDPRRSGRRGRGAGARPARRPDDRLRDLGRARAALPSATAYRVLDTHAVRPQAAPHLPARARTWAS